MWKKIIATVLAVIATSLSFCQISAAVKEEIEEAGRTEDVPSGFTPIYDIADLSAINNNLTGSYILMNDIDLSETAPGGSWDLGNGWAPIGSDTKGFAGTLDGNGHFIKNMHIYGNIDRKRVGLFACITNNSKIMNLGLSDCEISVSASGEGCVGGIAGLVFSTYGWPGIGVISNCFVTGKIANTSENGGSVGGLIGRDDSLPYQSAYELANDCYNAASLQISADKEEAYIGGIVGYCRSKVNLKRCYNIGTIQGLPQQKAGGISGYCDGSIGSGLFYLKTSVSNISGKISSYGTALTEAQMQTDRTFQGYDFEDIWYMDELAGYVYPQLKSCPQARMTLCELETLPDKLEYAAGEDMDVTGGVISISYEDGIKTSLELEESMVSGYDKDVTGIQTVTVSYRDARMTFDITVKEVPAESLQLNYDEYELNRNQRLNLEAVIEPDNATNKEVEWETDNELVAEVSQDGIVRGINAGTANITARTSNGIEAVCSITVKVPAKKLKLDMSKLTLKKGRKKKVRVVMTPLDSTDEVMWTSSNPQIVRVSRNGVVFAKKQGSAVVMAKTTSGISKKIKIYVI